VAPDLPSSVRVIVRGMLNCNQVVLRSPGANLLVDTGYCTHGDRTLALVRASLAGEPLARLVNTHCHADHMGGNAAIARAYGCRITIPAGEAKHVYPWTPETGSAELFDHRVEPFRFDDTLAPGDGFHAGGFEWQVHAAPGHDMEALMFFEPRNRLLMSGDALWQGGMGIVWPEPDAGAAIEASLETLASIERLAPAVIIPGHGEPFPDAAGSIARVRSRLAAFGADPAKNARHVLKVLFAFALLERGTMPLAEVARYLARVPCYERLSTQYLGLDLAGLAEWLVRELERAGAVVIADGTLRPTMAA
jgi:glyoxylase-like metal-dependent hydrolase (beta-lactamase superfamily II)